MAETDDADDSGGTVCRDCCVARQGCRSIAGPRRHAILLETRKLAGELCEAGSTFHERVTRVLADLEEARAQTSSLNARPRGLLRINIPGAFGRLHVMPHMRAFLAENPDIRLDATLTDMTVDIIETGTDVAVRIGALADSTLIARRLAPQKRLPVASPRYLSERPHLSVPDDLRSHECLVFALQHTNAWYCRPAGGDTELAEIGVSGHLRANDSEALRAAALDDLGIALLPTWLVADDLGGGRLQAVLGDWEWLIAPGVERAIWAVYPPKKTVPPKVKAFVDFLVRRFGSQPYWDNICEYPDG